MTTLNQVSIGLFCTKRPSHSLISRVPQYGCHTLRHIGTSTQSVTPATSRSRKHVVKQKDRRSKSISATGQKSTAKPISRTPGKPQKDSVFTFYVPKEPRNKKTERPSKLALQKDDPDVVRVLKELSLGKLQKSRANRPSRFTITTPSPNNITKNHVLESIKKYTSVKPGNAYTQARPSVTILTTPSFATWLDDEKFISLILEHLLRHSDKPSQIPSFMAVVDALPLPTQQSDTSTFYRDSSEGFAFMVGNRDIHLRSMPNFAADQAAVVEPAKAVTFDIYDSHTNRVEVTLPFANTLFRNGKEVTQVSAIWERTSVEDGFRKSSSHVTNAVRIHMHLPPKRTVELYRLPLTKLTPFRRIVSGLGNIIRQITDASGDAQPASTELEAAVQAYQKSKNLEGQGVTVWASVMTPEMLLPGYSQRFNYATRTAYNDYTSRVVRDMSRPPRKEFTPDVMHSGQALTYGCKLYRVLSGGGGWGVKAGLLSLDPQTSYAATSTARYDFQELDNASTSKEQALGAIAEPGSIISFWISHDSPPPQAADITSTKDIQHGVVMGCIPSTMDDLIDVSTTTADDETTPELCIYAGLFGAMSEAGIFLESTPLESQADISKGPHPARPSPPMKTKMDVPFGTVQWDRLIMENGSRK